LKVQRQSNEADKQKKFKNITRLSAFFPERILARKQNRTFYEGNQSLFNRNFSDALVGAPPTSIGNLDLIQTIGHAIQEIFHYSEFMLKKQPSSKIFKRQCALYSKTLLTYFLDGVAEDDFTLVLVIQENQRIPPPQ
jgi:hypothetical protein